MRLHFFADREGLLAENPNRKRTFLGVENPLAEMNKGFLGSLILAVLGGIGWLISLFFTKDEIKDGIKAIWATLIAVSWWHVFIALALGMVLGGILREKYRRWKASKDAENELEQQMSHYISLVEFFCMAAPLADENGVSVQDDWDGFSRRLVTEINSGALAVFGMMPAAHDYEDFDSDLAIFAGWLDFDGYIETSQNDDATFKHLENRNLGFLYALRKKNEDDADRPSVAYRDIYVAREWGSYWLKSNYPKTASGPKNSGFNSTRQ